MNMLSGLKSKDAVALAFLVTAGFAYYSRYYDCGFNTGDEGALLLMTMRILDGQRPYAEIDLGYGLLWYYPLAFLFKITGVSFIVARIYLLSLAMLCSLLAYLTIRRQTRIVALAINVALLNLALPGDLQNICIPLVVLANMLTVSCIDLDRRDLPDHRVFLAALVVGVSWFTRADLALGAALVLIATLIAHTVFSHPPRRWPRRLARLFTLVGGAALLPALPMVIVAYYQGFLRSLLNHIQWPFTYLVMIPALARTNKFVETGSEVPTEAGTTLARIPLAAVLEPGSVNILGILTYLPLVSLALIASIACLRMLRRRRQGRSAMGNDTVGILALTGLAVSSFPQFFLFRPESAHLSFFMPGYIVLAAICLGRWVLPTADNPPFVSLRRNQSDTRAAPPGPVFLRLGRLAFGGLLVFHIGLYFWFGLGLPTTGSMIALSRGRTERFLGRNGVEVAVTPTERYIFDKVTRIVEAHTDDDDTLLCFPFGPGWNVMTNRRTFAILLYVDDSKMASGWQQKMVESIRRELPPVIIIDNWPVNGTEISRFKNWATQVMSHILSEYVLLDTVGNMEIYGLRQRKDDLLQETWHNRLESYLRSNADAPNGAQDGRSSAAFSNRRRYAAATSSQQYRSESRARPAAPIRFAVAASWMRYLKALPSCHGCPRSKRNPVSPSVTRSSLPVTRLATTGRPQAMASSTAFGRPS